MGLLQLYAHNSVIDVTTCSRINEVQSPHVHWYGQRYFKINHFLGFYSILGIVPEEPIKAGDVMMKIKLDHVMYALILSSYLIRCNSCKQTIMKVLSPESKKIVSDLNDFELISVFLILQKALGKKSHWYRYIDVYLFHLLSLLLA